MVIPAAKARDELKRRLDLVLAEGSIEELYPGAKAPKVYLGFPVNEPPFYAAVDEIVDAAETSSAASMGHAQVSFDLHVWLCARHTDLKAASDCLLAYIDAVFACVMADHTLGMAVDNAMPSVETAGTAADSSKRYIAAASVRVSCTVASACPAYIREAINAQGDS